MRRRHFLSTLATGLAAGTAGCANLGGESPTAAESDAPTDRPPQTTTTTARPTPTQSGQTRTTNPEVSTEGQPPTTATPTPTESDTRQGSADVNLSGSGWETEGESVSLVLVNDGDVPSGTVTATVLWFDEAGNYLGNDSRSLVTLPPGNTWAVEVVARTQFDVADFEVYTGYTPALPAPPANMSVQSTSLVTDRPAITGLVENTREERSSAQVIGQVYDSGWVTYEGTLTRNLIPAQTDWRFAIPLADVSRQFELGSRARVFLY